jgi:class 3 adenylate cyclase
VLPDVTDQDLEKLGVLLGHRRKLLRAIANLETSAKTAPDGSTVPASADPSPRDTAERRQVTVMFSDLVGSTALSARMDPEDLREVISAYQKCIAETVQRFGGFVAKYMGDGVLVYFGPSPRGRCRAGRSSRAGVGRGFAARRFVAYYRVSTDPCWVCFNSAFVFFFSDKSA